MTRQTTKDVARTASISDVRFWLPVTPPLVLTPKQWSDRNYAAVIEQFAVETNPRYRPRDVTGDGSVETFCNIFTWDVTRAMGAELPHWVDAKGNPAAPTKPNRGLNANRTVEWLGDYGSRFGWRPVNARDAQKAANKGHPVVAGWRNPKGTGHLAIVRPGQLTARGPAAAQAGARNFSNRHVQDGFGRYPASYWAHSYGSSGLFAKLLLGGMALGGFVFWRRSRRG